MKIAILGAGAMGSLFGGLLAQSGEEVTLVDVWQEGVDAVNRGGLRIEDKAGEIRTVHVRATVDPTSVGPVDLLLVFVKCYHTEGAVRGAAPVIGPDTVVLTLQNGWGNAPRIAALVGEERVIVGVTYHSATLVGPGHVHQAGVGKTTLGELNGRTSERVTRIAAAFNAAGIETSPTADVIKEIWSKLALNVCTLPASALLRFRAHELVEHAGTLELMRALLGEAVAVAQAQGIPLDFAERWEAITGLLRRAVGGKSSMLQDVENRRQTEIEVVNGAIAAAGERLGIPTPYNQTMVWMVRALEETFVMASRT